LNSPGADTQRLYHRIALQIRELIRCGEFRAGQRLPSERDLARQLGVSRPVVREAMIALEIAGLIDVRTGSGIYAKANEPDAMQAFSMPDAGPSPFDVIAARKVLEPEIALLAAGARTNRDLENITEALAAMKVAVKANQDLRPSDRLFHTRIAAATGNTVLETIVDQLWEQMMSPLFAGLHPRTGLPQNEPEAVVEHSQILGALRHRDGAAARELMRAHLARVETIMMGDQSE
jgi:DNA-binding FadR family transcriptional regulator